MNKLRNLMGFLFAMTIAAVLLVALFFRVTADPAGAATPPVRAAEATAESLAPAGCRAEEWSQAARANAVSLRTMMWAPFKRPETGWDVYVPLIQHELGTDCSPETEGFAAALAAWQTRSGLVADGLMTEAAFAEMRNGLQTRREFVRYTAEGACPETPDLITAARLDEGFGKKQVWMRPAALQAYRRMAAAARAEVPEIAADPSALTIFSGYRSPSADAARCEREGNCDGIVRARCSAHRTGLAADINVGHAPGYTVDSSADPNRLFMTRTPMYRWLLANASRYGFANYPFEPWHWEWTGEAP